MRAKLCNMSWWCQRIPPDLSVCHDVIRTRSGTDRNGTKRNKAEQNGTKQNGTEKAQYWQRLASMCIYICVCDPNAARLRLWTCAVFGWKNATLSSSLPKNSNFWMHKDNREKISKTLLVQSGCWFQRRPRTCASTVSSDLMLSSSSVNPWVWNRDFYAELWCMMFRLQDFAYFDKQRYWLTYLPTRKRVDRV